MMRTCEVEQSMERIKRPRVEGAQPGDGKGAKSRYDSDDDEDVGALSSRSNTSVGATFPVHTTINRAHPFRTALGTGRSSQVEVRPLVHPASIGLTLPRQQSPSGMSDSGLTADVGSQQLSARSCTSVPFAGINGSPEALSSSRQHPQRRPRLADDENESGAAGPGSAAASTSSAAAADRIPAAAVPAVGNSNSAVPRLYGYRSVASSGTGVDVHSALAKAAAASGPESKELPLLSRGCRSVALYKPIRAIDEGTYGMVWMAEERASGKKVALKQIKFEKIDKNEGFPITALREMNTLLALSHPNIVTASEVVVGSTLDKIYMVMEYLPHNLRSFLDALRDGSFFTQAEVKCLLHQLLSGLAHMHGRWLLHRDLKLANILMDNNGRLVICDFGLARRYGFPVRPYTPGVVTLWYRAPELLLGAPTYGTAVDVWSVGCIFAELLTKEPLFMCSGERETIQAIFKLLGTPREEDWPGWRSLPLSSPLRAVERNYPPQQLRKALKVGATAYAGSAHVSDTGLSLLSSLLTLDPARRISAEQALAHPWFTEQPLPLDPRLMPSFPSTA